ncbi:MAG: NlpC/P60 family protein [Succiniclasticum sp.]|jgi:hypothetical protein
MKQGKRYSLVLCLLLMLALDFVPGLDRAGQAAQPVPARETAAFWQAKVPDAERVLLDPDAVAALNRRIAVPDSGTGVWTPEELAARRIVSGPALREKLSRTWTLGRPYVYRGHVVTGEETAAFRASLNLEALPPVVKGTFAVTTARVSVRNLPMHGGLYDSAAPDDSYYDNVQESALDAGEPLIVYHRSRDGRFVYARSRTVEGWLDDKAVAQCSRRDWKRYAAPVRAAVVQDRDLYPLRREGRAPTFGKKGRPGYSYTVPSSSYRGMLLLGSCLPLLAKDADGSMTLLVPRRSRTGTLREKQVRLALPESRLSDGAAPYTTAQILTGAFRFKDSVYGWGSAYGSVDCSAFADAVYRAVGIVLPRNTSQIRKAPLTTVSLTGRNRQERLDVLKHLRPGALLHLPGHVMLYLGMDHGVPYAIHALSSYYEDGRKVYVRRVMVTDLLLHRKSGKTFLDELTFCQEVK